MPASNFMGPEPRSTPSGLKSGGGSPRALPPDLLREASGRLGILALIGVTLWITGAILERIARHAINPADPSWRQVGVPDAIESTGLLASLLMFRYSRRRDRNPQRCLDVGQFYIIFTAAAIGLLWHWHPVPPGTPAAPAIRWVGAVLLMFAAIVPVVVGTATT